MSRAEFFIRLGCSQPNIQELIAGLDSIAAGRSDRFELTIVQGREDEENPPRPRS
jgi:hypothetical protein